VRDQLVADWWRAAGGPDGLDALMIAARRDDVADLNARARTLMAADGRLGDRELDVAGRRFAVGDRVVALANAPRLGVLNGTRGVVIALDDRQLSLQIRTSGGEEVVLPADYLAARTTRGGPTLDHGYALTAHKAQGLTAARAFVLGREDIYREWGYVAMSRGRSENRLYLVASTHERDKIAPADPVDRPADRLVAQLGRSRAQGLALDAGERARVAALPTAELEAERARLAARLAVRSHEPAPSPSHRGACDREQRESFALQADERAVAAERAGDQAAAARERALAAHARDQISGAGNRSLSAGDDDDPGDRSGRERARHAAVCEELERRAIGQPDALTADVPAYLLAALGPPPERLSRRRDWQRMAQRVESYRERFGVEDPDRALGERLGDLRQHAEWRQVRREIAALRNTLDLDRERSAGRDVAGEGRGLP
jgi:hypothetical protein